ncbi:ER degradation-enhancing alpha-mannosidase-like protein 3 [Pleurostoma richardsiae]|uniref:ER degradation-enhancing alpha-mannosidase-like protein 3 n=1 Tax=Pleurostoma richardsiae TaxID=41990 RepID=A0AA38RQQ1_9PEZI|nr:ER degradation-enhancing alpha-mannosidase-like protein 3 [Pleurostoma richardsiae]
MRPPRIAILVLFFAASLFLFCRSISSIRNSGHVVTPATPQKSSFRSFFSFTAPFTLFPPNAIITLTDDNSTFLPARPAAFGPPLPAKGLSGQLWIGSGFADENLPDGEGEGELGCSDVPGYDDNTAALALKGATKGLNTKTKAAIAAGKEKNTKRDHLLGGPAVDRAAAASDSQPKQKTGQVDDGTDDYLHQDLAAKKSDPDTETSGTSHADIQSIQEAAEITGKVVLLSRGGCGFLEKVKWAQRRGAIALIVGDNQKGGPLIQMFARGDTSNVTIPAIFTSRTTAHLLSSLMQPGSFIEDTLDENGNPALKVQQSDKARKGKKGSQQATATASIATPKATLVSKAGRSQVTKKSATGAKDLDSAEGRHGSWFSRLFTFGKHSGSKSDRSRPPSSGRLDWVLVDDWNDEKDKQIRNGLEKATTSQNREDRSLSGTDQALGDNFQIGVQDWRDPDLVDPPSKQADRDGTGSTDTEGASSEGKSGGVTDVSAKKETNGPKGGSITPGSAAGGLISKIFGDDDEADFTETAPQPDPTSTPLVQEAGWPDGMHEGLWVTITPAGGGPFWDTMLVLLISPVFTLTVVVHNPMVDNAKTYLPYL